MQQRGTVMMPSNLICVAKDEALDLTVVAEEQVKWPITSKSKIQRAPKSETP
jgi:hypothetical protein